MTITKAVKLEPTSEQKELILKTLKEYIKVKNELLLTMFWFEELGKMTSRHIDACIPSALKNQCIREAKSSFIRFCKTRTENEIWNIKNPKEQPRVTNLPRFKKLSATWNNQNYSITDSEIAFPVYNGKSQKIKVKALFTPEIFDILSTHTVTTLRITLKNGKLVAQIAYEPNIKSSATGYIMGVDLGLKCPAVCYTKTGKVKFVGNGRQIKTLRRRYKKKRRKLGKAKKPQAIKTISNKENRIMQDIDHKLSRRIVDFAIANNVSVIRLEELESVREKHKATRTSRKNKWTKQQASANNNIHSWSYYRLSQFIEYKAALEGIAVEYVNPMYTSQKCPICGTLNHANDRNYVCSCGYHQHRDIVGAINICHAD